MRSMVIRVGLILSLLVGLGVGGLVVSQELPPEMRADQYLMEGQRALEDKDPAAAVAAFKKLDALPVAPPVDFAFWYGRALVEQGIGQNDVGMVTNGEGFLKQYLLDTGRESDHYTSALTWISRAEGKGLPRPQLPAPDAAAPAEQAAAPKGPEKEPGAREVKLHRCENNLWGEWECSRMPLILSRTFDANGIEKVTIVTTTGPFSSDSQTYPVDKKWHPNSKTGEENSVSCNGWNKYGYRVLRVMTRKNAPGVRSGRWVRYFVDNNDVLWYSWGEISKDQNGKFTNVEHGKYYCDRE